MLLQKKRKRAIRWVFFFCFALKYKPEVSALSGVHLTAISPPGSAIGGSNEVTPRSGPVY